MTESAGLTLIETQIDAVTNFDKTGANANIAIASWLCLNSGRSDHYAIIKPGPTERMRITMRIRDNAYRTIVEVWQQYVADGTTLTTLLGHVNNIADRLDKYPYLADSGNTIRIADASGFGEVTEQWTNKADGPSWLKRDIYVDWKEETTPAYAE